MLNYYCKGNSVLVTRGSLRVNKPFQHPLYQIHLFSIFQLLDTWHSKPPWPVHTEEKNIRLS